MNEEGELQKDKTIEPPPPSALLGLPAANLANTRSFDRLLNNKTSVSKTYNEGLQSAIYFPDKQGDGQQSYEKLSSSMKKRYSKQRNSMEKIRNQDLI